MLNPFEKNLSDLKDSDLDEQIKELSKKYYIAQKLGKIDLLTQLTTFVNIYKEEQRNRYQKNLNKDIDKDLDTLINVD